MSNFLVIFICMFAGIYFKRLKNFPANSAHVINNFIIYLSLPALVLSQIPQLLGTIDLKGPWWLPVSLAWLTIIISFLFFLFIGKKFKWSQAKIGALILTGGLGNTSYVGFPILEALIGPEAIPIGVLVDQPGTFLVLSTVGIAIASFFSGAKINASVIAKKVFYFPPFIALELSILWAITGLAGIEVLTPVFAKIASTLVPLALFAVGFQLRIDLKILKKRWLPLSLGMLFKLILVPALFAFFYIRVLDGNDLVTHVIVIESAMASMITSAVVASEFNLDTELANLMVGIGIPLSLLTVPIWNYFLFIR